MCQKNPPCYKWGLLWKSTILPTCEMLSHTSTQYNDAFKSSINDSLLFLPPIYLSTIENWIGFHLYLKHSTRAQENPINLGENANILPFLTNNNTIQFKKALLLLKVVFFAMQVGYFLKVLTFTKYIETLKMFLYKD